MSLLNRNGVKAQTWSREESATQRIFSFEALLEAPPGNQQVGVEIANTVRVPELEPYFGRLALIAIRFPSFSDGRGFSIAKSLRNAGYRGTLRAVGPLIADQFAYALACGFDEVELPAEVADRQPVAIWLAAARAFRATYQTNHQAGGKSILEQRRAARGRTAE